MSAPLCIVSGVGHGAGAAACRRFTAGGYQVAMLARTTSLTEVLEGELPGAVGFRCDIGDEAQVNETIASITDRFGPPSVCVSNAVRTDAVFGDFLEIDPRSLEQNLRVNTMGLLYLARAVAPPMIAAGRGAIIATGNTAATRGRSQFAGFAPSKAAQRILAESIARTLGPKGVHVAYLIIDGGIDGPFAREVLPDRPDNFFSQPAAIAETLWHLAHQDRSAWSFTVDLRPFGETW